MEYCHLRSRRAGAIVMNMWNLATMTKTKAKQYFISKITGRPSYSAMAQALEMSPNGLNAWPEKLEGWRLALVEAAIKVAKAEKRKSKKASGGK